MTVSALLDKIGSKIYYPVLIACIVFDLVFNQKIESREIGYTWLYDVRVLLHSMVFINITMFLTVRVFIPMPKLVSKKWVILGRAGVIVLYHVLLYLFALSAHFS
ncbi:MAG: hypothetical protein WCP74_02105 [Sphingobacteriia bacterium]|jgi:hypothetical protein